MEELLERIQGSREEIEAYLQGIHACKIDGKCCCISIAEDAERLEKLFNV